MIVSLVSRTPHRVRLLLACLSLPALPAQAHMSDVGVLPNGLSSQPGAVSGDGRVVVGQAVDAANGQWLFRWTAAGGMVAFAQSNLGSANATNVDGSVIAGADDSSGHLRAFRWDKSSGLVGLGTLGGLTSEAWGISADGRVIVGAAANAAGVQRAFSWTAGQGMQDLGSLTLNGTSIAYDVSADGRVAVGAAAATGGSHAVRWQGGALVDLGTLYGGATSTAAGVNADGSVVVGTSGAHAFRWTATTGMHDLGSLGGALSAASDVSADGSVVVGSTTLADGSERAYRWTAASGMSSLGLLSGGSYSAAEAVSDDGNVIVGRADNSQGDRTFVWKLSALGQAPLQDLGNLHLSVADAAEGSAHLLNQQARLSLEMAEQTCLPSPEQRYCLDVGGGLEGGSERQTGGNAGGGLRVTEHLSVGASVAVTQAHLRTVEQNQGEGLGVWLAYQQYAEAGTGWRATAGVAVSGGNSRLQRGEDLADVQKSSTPISSAAFAGRVALAYGITAGTTLFTPELALSHVRSRRDGYHERGVALPLQVDSSVRRQTYASLAVQGSTPMSAGGSLELRLAAEVLLGDEPPAFSGQSAIPGLDHFSGYSGLHRRRLVPAAMAGYRLQLNRNASLTTQVYLSASAFEQQRPPYGVELHYRYAF